MNQQLPLDDYGAYGHQRITYDGKRMRPKPINRKTVDFNSPVINHLITRYYSRDHRDFPILKPLESSQEKFMAPSAYQSNPVTSITSRFIHTSTNKARCPINTVTWTPEGRRLITGSSSGEFTLWNGLAFNFETILQAHDSAIRAMVWSHNGNWMVTGDHGGDIKYWQPNMNNVKHVVNAHDEAVRDISFCPTDKKFASCSDDVTIKIWDFSECQQEAKLKGHGWDVKCLAWHPHTSLIVSGSKDNDVKTAQRIATLHGHKNTVLDVEWNKNGNWVLTASRDQLIKLYDIRTMRELQTFRGHKKEATCLAWHPFHEEFFVSGGSDGAMNFWLVGDSSPVGDIPGAHENSVWDLCWHPVGHILASGSNDHTTKFWCRQRPGDTMSSKFHQPSAYNNHYDPDQDEEKKKEPKVALEKEEPPSKFPVNPGYIGDLSRCNDIPCLGAFYVKPPSQPDRKPSQPQPSAPPQYSERREQQPKQQPQQDRKPAPTVPQFQQFMQQHQQQQQQGYQHQQQQQAPRDEYTQQGYGQNQNYGNQNQNMGQQQGNQQPNQQQFANNINFALQNMTPQVLQHFLATGQITPQQAQQIQMLQQQQLQIQQQQPQQQQHAQQQNQGRQGGGRGGQGGGGRSGGSFSGGGGYGGHGGGRGR